jgi:hypothetical protein
MLRKQLVTWIAAAAVGLAACSDGAVGPGDATEEDRQEILDLLDESGFFADDFSAEGALPDAAAQAGAALFSGAAAEVTPPEVWGRRRLEVLRRSVTVDVDVPNGIAEVSKEIEFEGAFLLDITDDATINPTSKPLAHIFRQNAVFERRDQEEVDAQGRRRWRLVSISPAELVMPDPATQTVAITEVQIEVNGVPVLTIVDPSQVLDVETEILHLQQGDLVTVRAFTENANVENMPPTFVYLHLFHASPVGRRWDRFLMDQADEAGTEWVLSWTARQTGRERIGVDAIDAETFTTETEDDYRASVWGVPYLVEEGVE